MRAKKSVTWRGCLRSVVQMKNSTAEMVKKNGRVLGN